MNMENIGKMHCDKKFFIGLSLSNSPNYDSGVAVLDENLKIISLDKLYSNYDVATFFKNFISLQNSVIAVSLVNDNSLLEGRWRIQSKNYKMISEGFEINENNWTNRLSSRCQENFLDLKHEGYEIFRYFNFQLRYALGVNPHYSERTSLDCKSLQTSLKIKFGFDQLPENMLPASNLEAILGAMFAKDVYTEMSERNKNQVFNSRANGVKLAKPSYSGVKFKKIFEYCGLDVLQREG